MVQESVLDKIRSDNLVVHVVWTPVLPLDDHEAAVESRGRFLRDSRAIHYWDEDQDVGLLYGKILALPSGRNLAWDIYLAFEAGTGWAEEAPVPTEWFHQLGQDGRHLGAGEGYRTAVENLLSEHVGGGGKE